MTDSDHRRFMKEALALAQSNAGSISGGPFGALIVRDGEVISSASNTVTVDNDPTAHAEVNAIRKACRKLGTFDLKGCVLYTSCEPCPMCLSAAYWAHIDQLFYAADRFDAAKAGFDDNFIYKEFTLPLSERTLPINRILDKEGLVPFELWACNEDKILY